jgi:hypothetical protein
MKNIKTCLFAAIFLPMLGCTASPEIRQKAINLDRQILSFRDEQKSRVDKLNQDYREAADQYLTQLRHLADLQLSLDRDHDTQALSDDLLGDDANALPGKFADRIVATMTAERDHLLAVDKSIQAARDEYAKNYQVAKLALNKLDDLHEKLKVLSDPDTDISILRITVLDAEAAYNGVKAAQKEIAAKKQSTTKPTS